MMISFASPICRKAVAPARTTIDSRAAMADSPACAAPLASTVLEATWARYSPYAVFDLGGEKFYREGEAVGRVKACVLQPTHSRSW